MANRPWQWRWRMPEGIVYGTYSFKSRERRDNDLAGMGRFTYGEYAETRDPGGDWKPYKP